MKHDWIEDYQRSSVAIDEYNFNPDNEDKPSGCSKTGAVLALFGVAVVSAATFTSGSISKAVMFKSSHSTSSTTSTSSSSYWTLYREGYSPLSYFSDPSPFLKYSFLEGYSAVIEPYANMHLAISDFDSSSGDSYEFTVCLNGCVAGTLSADSSVPVSIPCTPLQEYSISIDKVSSDGSSSRYASGSGMCSYVRREIQSLSDGDLTATMDAMYALWAYSDEEGQALYGENFRNISYFAGMHFFGASHINADHIHEGLAFLPQHVKMSNKFEVAMQAVDPSITLPYWDFTIDSAHGTALVDLAIFQEETFGSLTYPADPDAGWLSTNDTVEDARIPNGRWANLRAEANNYFPDLKYGYGLFRAPWNANPSPYITRFVNEHALPGCIGYTAWAGKSTLMKFLEYAPGNPHASIHGDIGGVFGCDNLDFALEKGYIASSTKQKALCSKWGFKIKSLYRTNDIVPYRDCTVNAESPYDSECGVTCVSSEKDMIESMDDIMGKYFTFTSTSDEGWKDIREFICTGNGYKVFYGDHLESSSAVDPSFWSIHPTQERFLQAMLMADAFTSMDWNSDADSTWVCERSECYMPELSDGVDYHPECCLGHYEFDGYPDYEGQRTNVTIGMTNREVIDATDPTSKDYSMPYIYDSFSWSHCASAHAGDVDSTLEKIYKEGATSSDDDDDSD